MRPPHRSTGVLLAGVLSVAAIACGGSGKTVGGTGGATPPTTGSGGAGGSATGGTTGSGGITSSGGTISGSGGVTSSGGTTGSGGKPATGGATGGTTSSSGGVTSSGGMLGTGGGSGGVTVATGGAVSGGRTGSGGLATGGSTTGTGGTAGATSVSGSGGAGATGGTGGATSGKGGSTGTGTCTPSKPVSTTASGSGSHKVTVETNADPGIKEGTIFRPTDLGTEKYPIFVWGEGACARNGLANTAAMGEIASHGYFVVADGTPNGTGNLTMDRNQLAAMGAPLMAYIDWAIAENDKPCSAYYHSLDTTKIAADGFSCGGLMAQAMVLDARVTTWGVTSSGMAGATQSFYDLVHTPVLFVEGGTSDSAYNGAGEGYAAISKLSVPVMWFSKNLGHGGDLSAARGGDFTKLNLAWLNWWLKGDETATGKGLLVGAGCSYCKDSAWEVKSANVP